MNLVEPSGWLGAPPLGLSGPMPGVRDQSNLQALRAELAGKGPNGKRGYAHVDNGKLIIDWPYHDHGGWGDAAPKNHADVLMAFGIDAKAPFYPTLLKILGLNPKTAITKGWQVNTSYGGGGGFDLGNALNQIGSVVSQVVPGILPGSSALAALITGKDPIAALKQDLNNFSGDADLAKAVASGDWGKASAVLNNKAKQLGIPLPPGAVQAAVNVAKGGGNLSDMAQTALGSGYTAAWNAATNFGTVLTDLKPPAGLSYKPGAAPLPTGAAHPTTAKVEAHPATAPARKVIALHIGGAAPAASASPAPATPSSKYGPYPKR